MRVCSDGRDPLITSICYVILHITHNSDEACTEAAVVELPLFSVVLLNHSTVHTCYDHHRAAPDAA